MNKPDVSVVMSTYNRAKFFLPRAIESVLNQKLKNFELIIIDDYSSDNTKKVVESFQKEDARIRYIRRKKNFGCDTKGKNEGIKAARADLVCFLRGSLVETKNGAKRIENIKAGELVKTHTGGYKRVLKTSKRPYKERSSLVWVSTGDTIIKCTPEHPFLVRRTGGNYQWIRADGLRLRDKLFYPEEEKKDYLNFDCLGKNFGGKAKNAVYYGRHRIGKDMARFLGLYLAEGCGGHDSIRFTLNNNETGLINFVRQHCKKTFQREPTVYKRWATVVKLNIRSFSDLFIGWFGKEATVKKIPEFVFDWSLTNRLAFIKGYMEGDGSKGKSGCQVISASKKLMDGFVRLCRNSGLYVTDHKYIKPTTATIKGRDFTNKGAYYCFISQRSIDKLNDILGSVYFNGKRKKGFLLEIKALSNKKMTGSAIPYVYNLEVEDDNSYLVGPVSVHNCFLDDDNAYRPDHLTALKKVLDRNSHISVVYGDRWIHPSERLKEKGFKEGVGIHFEFDPFMLKQRNFIDTSDVMVRKSTLLEVGGFDEKLKKFVDWNLWWRITKLGRRFQRVAVIISDYYLHDDMKSMREKGGEFNPTTSLFTPTFNMDECLIHSGGIGREKNFRVAIFTLTMNRLEYTKKMFESIKKTTNYPFDHYVVDNGSTDGTKEYLKELEKEGRINKIVFNKENKGIPHSSNQAISAINPQKYDYLCKIDNDAFFKSNGWLEAMIEIYRRNNRLCLSPYIEGLAGMPGGTPRVVYGTVAGEFLGVVEHLGGIVTIAPSRVYWDWRWPDNAFMQGGNDVLFCSYVQKLGYQLAYMENYKCEHIEGTIGQEKKFPEYFEDKEYLRRTRYEEGERK